MTALRRPWRATAGLRYHSSMRAGMRTDWALGCVAVLALALAAGSGDDVTLGWQWWSASSGKATLAPGGTSCAPCETDDVELDPSGCPVLVTWDSCGGDICIGRVLLQVPSADAGASDGGDAGDAAADASSVGDASSAGDASGPTDAGTTDDDGGTP